MNASLADSLRVIPPVASGSGDFGRWTLDDDGLPAYDYECDPAAAPWAASFRTDGPRSADHWHQVGNDRIVATAHAEGHVVPFLSDRGKTWLAAVSPRHQAWGGGFGWLRDGERTAASSRWSTRPPGALLTRRFGVGYFEKRLVAEGIEVRHRVTAPFGDDPVLRVEILLQNLGDRPRTLEWVEHWGVRLEPVRLHLLSTGWIRPPAGRTASERAVWRMANLFSALSRRIAVLRRRMDAALFSYRAAAQDGPPAALAVPRRRGPRPRPTARAAIDCYPEPLFLACLEGGARVACHHARAWFGRGGLVEPDGLAQSAAGLATPGQSLADPCLIARTGPFVLEPGAPRRIVLLYGAAPAHRLPELAARHATDRNAVAWRAALPYVHAAGLPWLTRELAWHGAMLRSHLTWEEYFGNHICDQGCAYGYLQGMNSVPRDMVLTAVPFIYLAPERARETLRYILRMVRPDGVMYYATYGRGLAGFAGIHTHPSDLWPMVFWAVAEYIGATHDTALLDEEVPFYPVEAGSGTVLARLRLGLSFLLGRVGCGEHGLLRVGSGDWSDGIQLMVRSRRRFLRDGESTYTGALAEMACRRLAGVVAGADPDFAAALEELADKQGVAWRSQFNGRWYRRAWDGAGTPIGDADRLFLEHHAWCLVAGVPPAHVAPLLAAIEERLQAGSRIGTRIVDPPMRTRFGMLTPGWDVNGGIWAAMNGVFTWGLGLVDPARAWQELEANSLHRHAEVYPRCWYGIWSGPDAYNAESSERPGETFVHLATPMTDFPVMNMNRHSSTLLATLRLCGLDADGRGLAIRPRPTDPAAPLALSLPLCGYRWADGELSGYYRFFRDGSQRITAALPGATAPGAATVDGQPVEAAWAGGEATLVLDGRAGEERRFVLRAISSPQPA